VKRRSSGKMMIPWMDLKKGGGEDAESTQRGIWDEEDDDDPWEKGHGMNSAQHHSNCTCNLPDFIYGN
jgi:hypothetical protein